MPWLEVAALIIEGRYDNSDASTKESLTIGLRSIDHILCKQAIAKIESLPKPKALKI